MPDTHNGKSAKQEWHRHDVKFFLHWAYMKNPVLKTGVNPKMLYKSGKFLKKCMWLPE
jgi:hypothetical protein